MIKKFLCESVIKTFLYTVFNKWLQATLLYETITFSGLATLLEGAGLAFDISKVFKNLKINHGCLFTCVLLTVR